MSADITAEGESSTPAVPAEKKDEKEPAEKEDNAFCMLIKAARLMNPMQFELSKDIACTTPLPGEYGHYNLKCLKKKINGFNNWFVFLSEDECMQVERICCLLCSLKNAVSHA